MQVLDEREQVKKAIKAWNDDRGRYVSKELLALDKETASAADVAEIIGNDSWVTRKACGECGKETWNIVQIGEPLDHESCTAYLCSDCLRAALKLLDAE